MTLSVSIPSSVSAAASSATAALTVDPVHRLSAVYVQHVTDWPATLGIVHLQLRDALYPALGIE